MWRILRISYFAIVALLVLVSCAWLTADPAGGPNIVNGKPGDTWDSNAASLDEGDDDGPHGNDGGGA